MDVSNAQYWMDLMERSAWHGAPPVVTFGRRLKSGQWRLDVRIATNRTALRRRRIVRVATVKYRARRARGK